MKKYKIGDFAKEFSIANSFLKYYEQQGILEPSFTEKGYRYYDFCEADSLIAGIKYRNLGFSLKEVAHILTKASIDEIESELVNKTEEYAKQIAHLRDLLAYVDFIQGFCKIVKQKACWNISIDESFCFLPHSRQRTFIEDEKTRERVKEWLNVTPSVDIAVRMIMENVQPKIMPDGSPLFNWGLMGKSSIVERQFSVAPPIEKIHFKRCAKYYYSQPSLYDFADGQRKYPNMKTEIESYFNPILSIIKAHNFKLCGDIYMHFVMHTKEEDGMYNHAILYAPIE